MTWLDKTLSAVGLQRQAKAAPKLPTLQVVAGHLNLAAMSAEQLTTLSQQLGLQQDALKMRRREIAKYIDAHLTKKGA